MGKGSAASDLGSAVSSPQRQKWMVSGASLSRWLRVPDMVTVDVAVGYAALRPDASACGCMLDQLQSSCGFLVCHLLMAAVRQRDGDASMSSVPAR